ncbi:PABP [Hepatospora eriocheir]|uniref:PABP n=1 Tax=Hepatospora eriocheir TaxID=1081669 RepID=A0A1X0Q8L8_9MICR|nr:PABP [Hepatospora eriocheir]
MSSELTSSLKNLNINSEEKKKQPTIHCGDLSLKTTTADIKDLFKDYNVLNTFVKKTPNGQYCYAFIVFASEKEMEKAIKDLNYSVLHGKEVIMCKYDPAVKIHGEGNIFVSGIPSTMKASDLNSMFSEFGDIITCKIATDANGKSKNYGFVKYRTIEAANKAVEGCIGFKVDDNLIRVEHYDPKKKIRNSEKKQVFTNCFVKNFPPSYTEEDLRMLLEVYGEITDIYFPLKENGNSVGFACVNFKKPESATKAIEECHDKQLFTKEEMGKSDLFEVENFYIVKSDKRKSRIESIADDSVSSLAMGPKLKRNLYIKNVPAFFNEKEVLNVLSEFGSITDFHLSVDHTSSDKLYGCVCYSTVEEAAVALEMSKQVLLDGNQLELSIYRSKREREIESAKRDAISIKNHGLVKEDEIKEFSEQDKRLNAAVLSISKNYEKDFGKLNVVDSKEFSDKITRKILSVTNISKREALIEDKSSLMLYIDMTLKGVFNFKEEK